MAILYADENFPFAVVVELRALGHDVLTAHAAGQANQKIPDPAVLAFATARGRAVLTLNRGDYVKLHWRGRSHAGIIVCTDDADVVAFAQRIHQAILAESPLDNKLIRVNKPSTP